MATTYKVLGQALSSASTTTSLYTVPANTSTIVSTLSICNQGPATTIRTSVRPAGVPLAPQHYVLYEVTLPANDTLFFTIGLTLAATDVVSIYAGTSNVSFNLYGSEIA
jgi:hypothetical protein